MPEIKSAPSWSGKLKKLLQKQTAGVSTMPSAEPAVRCTAIPSVDEALRLPVCEPEIPYIVKTIE